MGQIAVFSPAKINLFLAVFGRLESGYHELASLVAPLDFGDEARVSAEPAERASVALTCDEPQLPTDRRNLAYAAAERFLERYGLRWSARIELAKRIPHGAGLGGGSSNAAAVLTGLARLAAEEGVEPSVEALEALAGELGSDCPLFVRGQAATMRGRGERLSAVSSAARRELAGRRVALFKPSFGVSTAWAYGRLAAGAAPYDERGWAEERLAAWEAGELSLEALLYNRFEAVARAKYPAYGALFERLLGLGVRPLLSGSGSACFALVEGEDQAEAVLAEVAAAWGVRSFRRVARIAEGA